MNGHIIILICVLCFCGFLYACSTVGDNTDGVSSATLNESFLGDSEFSVNSSCAIVLFSSAENNTFKLAKEIASVLDAQILPPQIATPELLSHYDLVGFGSGIFDQQHHRRILEIAGSLPESKGKRVFIFSTSGVSRKIVLENDIEDPHDALRNILEEKGCDVVGEFNSPGFNRNSFLILFGGINKGRPNSEDLQNAQIFAEGLLPFIGTPETIN
jgi:flavodoxin